MDSAFAIICCRNKNPFFLRDNIPTIPTPNSCILPGGGIEAREALLKALRRELIEEVSYYPKNLTKIGKVRREKGFAHPYYSFVKDKRL